VFLSRLFLLVIDLCCIEAFLLARRSEKLEILYQSLYKSDMLTFGDLV